LSAAIAAIVNAYKRPHVLARALESVLAQTLAPVEIIVIDDDPEGSSEQVAQRFADRGVRYHRNETNLKLGLARNVGMRLTTAPYLAFLDDDDAWLPNKLQRQMDVLEHAPPDVAGVTSNFEMLDEGTNRLRERRGPTPTPDHLPYPDIMLCRYIRPSTIIYRRAPIEAIGFNNARYDGFQNMEVITRLARDGFRMVNVPDVLVTCYCGPDQISMLPGRSARAWQMVLEDFGPDMQDAPHVEVLFRTWLVRDLLRLERYAEARKECLRLLRLQPRSMRGWTYLVTSNKPGAMLLDVTRDLRMRLRLKSVGLKQRLNT
jgi:glycosyltransferase involved in cell wall biosynthesis